MKTEKCSMVYKIVKMHDGKMYSSNPNPQVVDIEAFLENPLQRFVQYRMKHVTRPKTKGSLIFVCKGRADAERCAEYFENGGRKSVRILRGYGCNVFKNTINGKSKYDITHLPFETYLCDWFVPIGIIK